MTYKRPFKFDFDEDADPVEELHRLRVATREHFKTDEALFEYYNSCPPVEVLIADLEKEIAAKKAKEARARVPGTAKKTVKKTAGKTAARRKPAKRLAPA